MKKLLVSLLLFSSIARAQENLGNEENSGPYHSLAILLAHAHVFDGRDADNHRTVLGLPAWSLDYDYHFNSKWQVGLHTDLIVETFKVEKHLESDANGEVVERSYPIAPAVMCGFKPNHHWTLLLGAGAEFASEGNYFLSRAAAEYGVEISRGWEVNGSLGYDFKWNAYDTWILGIGIAKSFGRKHAVNKEH